MDQESQWLLKQPEVFQGNIKDSFKASIFPWLLDVLDTNLKIQEGPTRMRVCHVCELEDEKDALWWARAEPTHTHFENSFMRKSE